jgi:phage-related protein
MNEQKAKVKKEYKQSDVLTPRQQRVVQLLAENTCKTKKEIMQKAGYAKASQTRPSRVLEAKTVKKALKSFRDIMAEEAREAMEEAKKKRHKAKYKDLIDATDKLRKQVNTIDGIGNENTQNIIVLPNTSLNAWSTIEGEIVEKDTKQLENEATQGKESNEKDD